MESSVEASQSSTPPNPKPSLGPKPRLTARPFSARPFSMQNSATFRSINAPKIAQATSESKTPTDTLNATGGYRTALTTPAQPTSISAFKPRPLSLPSENHLKLTKASEVVPPREDSPDSGVSDPAPKTTPSSEPVQKDNVIQTNHETSTKTLSNSEQKNEIKTEDETPVSVPQTPEEPISDSPSTTGSPFRWGGTRKRLSMELTSKFESGGVPLPPQPVKTTTKPDNKRFSVTEESSEPEQDQAAPKPLTPESNAGEQEEDYNRRKSIKDRISCLFDSVGKQESTWVREEPTTIDCGVPLSPQPVKTTTKPDTKHVSATEESSEPEQNQAAPKPLTPESKTGEQEDNNRRKSIKDRISCLFDNVGKQEGTWMREDPTTIDGIGDVNKQIKNWAAETGSESPDTEKKPQFAPRVLSKSFESAAVSPSEKTPEKLTVEVPAADESQKEPPMQAPGEDESLEISTETSGENNKTTEGVKLRRPPTSDDTADNMSRRSIKRRSVRFGIVETDDGSPPVVLGSDPESSTEEEEEEEEANDENEKGVHDSVSELGLKTGKKARQKNQEIEKKEKDDKEARLWFEELRNSVESLKREEAKPLEDKEESEGKLLEEKKGETERLREEAVLQQKVIEKEGKKEKEKEEKLKQDEEDRERERLKEVEMEGMKERERQRQKEEQERLNKELELRRQKKEEEKRLKQEGQEKERLREEAKERKRLEEEERMREKLRQEEEKRLREEQRQEEERLREKQRKEEEEKRLREKQRQEEEEARLREKQRQEEEARLREKQRQEEEERLREKQRQEEEARLREKQRQEEAARLREKQRQEEEKQRQEEAMLREKQRQEEEARLREKQRQEEAARLREKQRQEEEKLREKQRQEEAMLREKQRQEEERLMEKQRQEEARLGEKQRQEEEERKRRELERKMQQEKEGELERKREEERREEKSLMEKESTEVLERKKQGDLEKLQADKYSETDKEENKKEPDLMMNFDSGHWFQKKESDNSPSLKTNNHTETLIDVVYDDFSIKKPSADVEYDDFSVKPRKWASQTKAEPVRSSWAVDRGDKEDLLMSCNDQPQESQKKEKQVEQESVVSFIQENPAEEETKLLVNLEMKEEECPEDDVEVEEEEEAEEEENGEEEERKEDEAEEEDNEAQINSFFTNDENKQADNEYKTPSDSDSPKSLSEQLPDVDCVDSHKEPDFIPFPEMSTPLLDTSTQRSKAQLSRKRNRSRPSRSFRVDSEKMGKLDWRVHDTTDKKETLLTEKELDSDKEEEEELSKPKAVISPPSIIPKVPMFPGLSPAALLAGIKKRTGGEGSAAEEEMEKNKEIQEKERQNEEVEHSLPQLSQSPRLPSHLAGAARVLPPMGSKDGGATVSPAWLKELKSKKRMSQHGGKT